MDDHDFDGHDCELDDRDHDWFYDHAWLIDDHVRIMINDHDRDLDYWDK